jgi:hypothetical protein
MVKLFVEGGGPEGTALSIKLRNGFYQFFEKLAVPKQKITVLPKGGRDAAFEDFKTSLDLGENAFLLVDSETPFQSPSVWQHLTWEKPAKATNDNSFLMVQIMESWFMSNETTLQNYFGDGFKTGQYSQSTCHLIRKYTLQKALVRATKLSIRGRYTKGLHSPDLLALINPASLTCPEALRFITTMKAL